MTPLLIFVQGVGVFVIVGMAFGIVSENLIREDTTYLSLGVGLVSATVLSTINARFSRFELPDDIEFSKLLLSIAKYWVIAYALLVAICLFVMLVVSQFVQEFASSDVGLAMWLMGLWFPIWISLVVAPEIVVSALRSGDA